MPGFQSIFRGFFLRHFVLAKVATSSTGELGYDGPLYNGFLHMTDDMLGPSQMHIKYSSYVYDGFCIWRTNFPGPIQSVISKFTCIRVTEQYLTHSEHNECLLSLFIHLPAITRGPSLPLVWWVTASKPTNHISPYIFWILNWPITVALTRFY